MKKITIMMFAFATLIFTNLNAQNQHPYYLHALSDLRAARWMIEHRPGNWAIIKDEESAVNQIDMAIEAIKKAAIDDGKDINDHPQAEEINDHKGRLKKALEYLNKAKDDIDKDEDKDSTKDLKKHAAVHVHDATIEITRAVDDVK